MPRRSSLTFSQTSRAMKLKIIWKDGDVDILVLRRNQPREQALQNFCVNMGRKRWDVKEIEVLVR